MTEQRVSQGGAEALFRVNPDARVSQGGSEYLHRVQPGVEVSQGGAEYLHRVQPSFAVSQGGVEFLYKSVPCGTQLVQIWTLTRLDGQVIRRTSLDRALEWPPNSGVIFESCGSMMPTASEGVAEVDSGGSMDLSGAVSLTGLSQSDLQSGLYDGAYVEAWLVPWSGTGSTKLLLSGTFGDVEHDERNYKVTLNGDGWKLQQTPLTRVLRPDCKHQFGVVNSNDIGCHKDLAPLTVTGTVDVGEGQREFTDADRAETPGYFKRGIVTFTGGNNAGIGAEIKEHEVGGVFTLWPRLPFAIEPGDTYSMVPGCTNLRESSGGCNGCDAWDQYVDYGGFRDVPTKDQLTAAADVKTDG